MSQALELGYCTNIHPGESLAEVSAALSAYVPRVRASLGRPGSLGLGLRLSARAARELRGPGAVDGLRALLSEVGAHVFTVNAFPAGEFHRGPVKERVYRPDFRSPARVAYTADAAWALAALLPEGAEGSVSTVPGAFRPGAEGEREGQAVGAGILDAVAALVHLERETGRSVRLALEPEPFCLLETTRDAVTFFERALLSRAALARLGALTGLPVAGAEEALRAHLGLCLDTCHLAVAGEAIAAALAGLRAAGIRVAKAQLTVAPRLEIPAGAADRAERLRALAAFDDGVYLHQVFVRRGGRLARYLDLPDALRGRRVAGAEVEEWRVHAHVPVFAAPSPPLQTTRAELLEFLDAVREGPVTPHLEVETYTFGVLPPALASLPVHEAIARELAFVWRYLETGEAS